MGYHPILATRADTRETLHIRLRKGSANTQKGIVRFCDELIARVTRAGATGVKLLRADSGFWNTKVFERLEQAGWQYSIGVRMIKTVRAAVEAIDEDAWQTIDYPEEGEAQIAETIYGGRRLIVRRTRLLGAQAELWPDWRHFAFITNRDEEIALVEAEHRDHAVVEQVIADLKDQALAHFPSGRLPRQRRLDRAGRARAQPPALDAAARAPGHDRPRRSHPAPLAAQHPRTPDPPRARMDTAPPGPLALARRLHQRAQPHPRAASDGLTAGPHTATTRSATPPPRPARPPLPANDRSERAQAPRPAQPGGITRAQPAARPRIRRARHRRRPHASSIGGSGLSQCPSPSQEGALRARRAQPG